MKNVTLLTILLFGYLTQTNAQFVTIPDNNFASFLQTNYPGAMVGNQMDTTNINVMSDTSLNIGNLSIQTISGIEYFDHLKNLFCNYNLITSIAALPPELIYLDCSQNLLSTLPTLPASLLDLNCSVNNFTSISTVLPNSLLTLSFNSNHLVSLPVLPPSLNTLSVDNNQLTSLPVLPNSMVILSCFKNQLTSLPNLPSSLQLLNCHTNLISSLPSLPASLIHLECSHNPLSGLPTLPSSIGVLRCLSDGLTTLPVLPASLTDFNCSLNSLTTLPVLPANLIEMNCESNLITILPSLPSSLYVLKCGNNQLTALPGLPNSLAELHCNDNLLTILPSLPNLLGFLLCSHNQLSLLPSLPNNLAQMQCDYNPISTLPMLPNGLHTLSCYYCQLTSLPALPNSVHNVGCAHNLLNSLPTLPVNLQSLFCSDNQLTTLPSFPPGLVNIDCRNNINLTCLPELHTTNTLRIDNTSISCLPNYFLLQNPLSSTTGLLSMPLCNATTGCPFYWNLAGNVHQDTSLNCLYDSINPGNTLQQIKVQLLKNNVVQQQMYITPYGDYSFDTGNDDTLDIQIDTIGLPFLISCPSSFNHHAILTPIDSTKLNLNFGLKCIGNDAGVSSIFSRFFRPTFTSLVRINAGDITRQYNMNCNAVYSGTVTTTYTGAVQYVSPAAGALSPTSVTGNVLTYLITDFSTLTDSSFNILLTTDTTAVIGTQVCFTTVVNNVTGDIQPVNDSLMMCFNVINSFDPNDKQVSPINAEAGDWLTYTIQFQNTGNDTAFLVVVKDTLSSNLDIPSFTFIKSSHPAIVQLNQQVATFSFPHINLLDSLNHEPMSHGWLQFKIKLKSNLANGTQTDNKAYIYFDINPPIITNVASNFIGPLNSSGYLLPESMINIFPNPTAGSINIKHSMKGLVQVIVRSFDGRILIAQQLTKSNEVIDLHSLSCGSYLIEVKNGSGEKQIKKIEIRK